LRFFLEIEERMTFRYFRKRGGVIHVVFGIRHYDVLNEPVSSHACR
jgi:hypothetical protein